MENVYVELKVSFVKNFLRNIYFFSEFFLYNVTPYFVFKGKVIYFLWNPCRYIIRSCTPRIAYPQNGYTINCYSQVCVLLWPFLVYNRECTYKKCEDNRNCKQCKFLRVAGTVYYYSWYTTYFIIVRIPYTVTT